MFSFSSWVGVPFHWLFWSAEVVGEFSSGITLLVITKFPLVGNSRLLYSAMRYSKNESRVCIQFFAGAAPRRLITIAYVDIIYSCFEGSQNAAQSRICWQTLSNTYSLTHSVRSKADITPSSKEVQCRYTVSKWNSFNPSSTNLFCCQYRSKNCVSRDVVFSSSGKTGSVLRKWLRLSKPLRILW